MSPPYHYCIPNEELNCDILVNFWREVVRICSRPPQRNSHGSHLSIFSRKVGRPVILLQGRNRANDKVKVKK